ncbi:hypothetical protein C8F04DRAFT_1177173 [Mycena alexandri]|uniref:Uncharacterized protein n=1 Tax=Mycena alexandri TaxID=1745969 RepID=A0AAD6T8Y2_9AGAR|nr:hypothetical protein C8F04DRAFT_1177173 [Mycena alexandri]
MEDRSLKPSRSRRAKGLMKGEVSGGLYNSVKEGVYERVKRPVKTKGFERFSSTLGCTPGYTFGYTLGYTRRYSFGQGWGNLDPQNKRMRAARDVFNPPQPVIYTPDTWKSKSANEMKMKEGKRTLCQEKYDSPFFAFTKEGQRCAHALVNLQETPVPLEPPKLLMADVALRCKTLKVRATGVLDVEENVAKSFWKDNEQKAFQGGETHPRRNRTRKDHSQKCDWTKVGEKLLVANAMGVPIPQDPVVDESEDVDEAGALPRESTGEPGQHCDTSEGVQIVASKEVGVNGPRDRAFIGRRGCWWGWVSLRCAAPDGLTDSGRWWWLEVKRGRCQRAARPRFYRRVGGGRAGFGMTAARRASGVDREFEGGRVGERERCRSRGWAVVGRQKRGREREVERVGDAVEMDEWLALGDLNAVSLEYVGGRGRGAGAAGRDAGR